MNIPHHDVEPRHAYTLEIIQGLQETLQDRTYLLILLVKHRDDEN